MGKGREGVWYMLGQKKLRDFPGAFFLFLIRKFIIKQTDVIIGCVP